MKMKKFFIPFLFFISQNFVNSELVNINNWEDFLQHPTYLPCASTLFNNNNNSTALLHARKASFATGKIIESLDIISLTYCNNDENCNNRSNKTIKDYRRCFFDSNKNISDCISEYPYISDESSMIDKLPFLSSLGLYDACYDIPEYHYCSIMVMNQPIWSYGICVPDICSREEIEVSLNKLAIDKANIFPTDKLFTSNCGDYKYPVTKGSVIMITLCCLLLMIVISGTVIDIYKDSFDGFFYSVFKCFSLRKNVDFLLTYTRRGDFDSFDGIRVLSILWVIFGHTFIFTMTGLGFTNLKDLIGNNNEGWISMYPAQALTGAYFAVDTFFFMSGFLGMIILMKIAKNFIEKEKILLYFCRIPIFYLKRFLRLTPIYFFILLFYLKIFPLLNSGPFWNLLDTDINFCNTYWWTNLLYINNLYPSGSQECYPVTWYLANDFQFFLILPFFAFFSVYYSHFISIGILLIGMIFSIVFAFVESYRNNWSINVYDPTFISDYFPNYYIKPWFRCPPYIIGIISGIVWYNYLQKSNSPLEESLLGNDTEKKRLKINKLLKYVLFLTSLCIFGVLIIGGKGAYSNTPSLWSNTVMSLYISLSKVGWTIGLAIISLLLFLKELPFLSVILENYVMSILSKLTFCMYLVHPFIIYWYYFSKVYPDHFSDSWYISSYLSIVFATTIVSTIVYLFVEKPISNIEKLLI